MTKFEVLLYVAVVSGGVFGGCITSIYWIGAARMNPKVKSVVTVVWVVALIAAVVSLCLLGFNQAARFWGLL